MRKFKTEKGQKILFMSDLHYGHSNCINLCNRPFKNVDEMDHYIEEELKNKVGPNDILFELGDFTWDNKYNTVKKLVDLASPAEFYKIIGNHDDVHKYHGQFKEFFNKVGDYMEIRIDDIDLILSHYPLIVWNRKACGSLMIHGHTHGEVDEFNRLSPDLRVDIGFDGELAKELGTFIFSFEDIISYFQKKAKINDRNFREYVIYNCDLL